MLSPSSNGSWVVGQEEELEMGRKVPVEQSLLAGRTHHSCLLFPLFQFFTHWSLVSPPFFFSHCFLPPFSPVLFILSLHLFDQTWWFIIPSPFLPVAFQLLVLLPFDPRSVERSFISLSLPPVSPPPHTHTQNISDSHHGLFNSLANVFGSLCYKQVHHSKFFHSLEAENLNTHFTFSSIFQDPFLPPQTHSQRANPSLSHWAHSSPYSQCFSQSLTPSLFFAYFFIFSHFLTYGEQTCISLYEDYT